MSAAAAARRLTATTGAGLEATADACHRGAGRRAAARVRHGAGCGDCTGRSGTPGADAGGARAAGGLPSCAAQRGAPGRCGRRCRCQCRRWALTAGEQARDATDAQLASAREAYHEEVARLERRVSELEKQGVTLRRRAAEAAEERVRAACTALCTVVMAARSCRMALSSASARKHKCDARCVSRPRAATAERWVAGACRRQLRDDSSGCCWISDRRRLDCLRATQNWRRAWRI